MCTGLFVDFGDGYFGRNLDYEVGFGERVIIVPRAYEYNFYEGEEKSAILGMGIAVDGYPLFFEGINEWGLGMASLRFAGDCVYRKASEGKENLPSYQFIPRILSVCKSADEAEKVINGINLTDEAFSEEFPSAPLHWLIADRKRAIVAEQTEKGMIVYENPVGVLTNSPGFDIQMLNLANYMSLSAEEPKNTFSDKLKISPYSRGMGAIGLPGDLSSVSRFVRASFIRENSVYQGGEREVVNQFFHTLYSVFQQRGCVKVGDNYEITRYSCCCNLDKGIYYYTTYDNSVIRCIDMRKKDLTGRKLIEIKDE